ncbi:MAG: type II toxin-antitoxin system VapC family toxin [Acidobacteriaceae bacterium]
MRILLDTHALVWAVGNHPRLSDLARNYLADDRIEKVVSAASAWEIATKVRLGKLQEARVLFEEFDQTLETAGYVPLPVTMAHALRAGSMPGEHNDPFDRMLAAQALSENIRILSIDSHLDVFGVRRIW